MNYSNYRVSLDIRNTGSQALLKFNQNDTARKIVFVLTEGGKPYQPTEDCTCFLSAVKPDGTNLLNDCTVDAENGTIVYTVTEQTTACVGTFDCQLTLTGTEGVISAPIFSIQVREIVTKEIDLSSTSEFNALVEMINGFNDYADRLQDLENNADNFSEVMEAFNSGKLKGEKGEKGDTGDSSDLNIRNGRKKGSLVQFPFDTAETPKEPTRDYQTLLGENPPANADDLLEVGQVFGVREDGTVYAKGEPKAPEDLIRRCDAPPLQKAQDNTLLYGIAAKKDGGAQSVFPASENVNPRWIPARTKNGDLLVPAAPSADNAAASKAFVNSSIATATSTFRGTFDMTEMEFKMLGWQTTTSSAKYYVEKNDYAFLYQNSTDGATVYTRYKWDGLMWWKEYQLNNSGFTAAQWSAINSGITNAVIESLRSSINGKRDLIPPPAKGDVGRLYCSVPIDDDHPQGMQWGVPYSPTKIASGVIPVRTTGGNILVPTPTAPEHAASKSYVDSKGSSVSWHDTAPSDTSKVLMTEITINPASADESYIFHDSKCVMPGYQVNDIRGTFSLSYQTQGSTTRFWYGSFTGAIYAETGSSLIGQSTFMMAGITSAATVQSDGSSANTVMYANDGSYYANASITFRFLY